VKRLAIALVLPLLGCSPKPKTATPAPPAIVAPKPAAHPEAKRRAGDMPIHGCVVTKLGAEYSDCLCRHASTKIDSTTGEQSLECRTK
jgi:hypothetical protein